MHLSTSAHPDPTPTVRGVELQFEPTVSMVEVQDTLELARLAAESLYGAERVEMEARWEVDAEGHTVAIGTTSRTGRTLAIVFLGLVKREFGSEAVTVARLRGEVAR